MLGVRAWTSPFVSRIRMSGLPSRLRSETTGVAKRPPNTGNVHMGVPLFPAATTTEPVCPTTTPRKSGFDVVLLRAMSAEKLATADPPLDEGPSLHLSRTSLNPRPVPLNVNEWPEVTPNCGHGRSWEVSWGTGAAAAARNRGSGRTESATATASANDVAFLQEATFMGIWKPPGSGYRKEGGGL